jgi:hypothetical protein
MTDYDAAMAPADLRDLGDALERAAERDVRRRRRPGIRRLVVAVAAFSIMAAGTAVAAGVFSPAQVAQGMPAGTYIFGQTDPSCVLDADGITYHCTLVNPPLPELSDFTGSKELVTVDDRIAGGCIGQDAEGMHWDCFMGDEAVKHEILVQDLLGQYAPEPGRG